MIRWVWTIVVWSVLWQFAVVGLGQAVPAIGDAEGLLHVDWKDAHQLVGRQAFVYGRVERVGHARRVHFLNFHPSRRDQFTGVLFDEALERFPDSLENLYLGKLVRLQGTVSTYRGTPQIKLSSPDQIRVIDQLPRLDIPKPQPKEASFPDVGQIVVATFNVLNLFDNWDDPYRDDESTRAKPRKELQQIADTILAMQADVVALQEVETRGYLKRFRDVFLENAGYEVVQYEGNDRRGIDVAVLTRLPVGRVSSYRHLKWEAADGTRARFNRDLLSVELLPDRPNRFELWVVHLKSNADGREFAEPIRLAEVKMLRKIYDRQLRASPDSRIVVCGDMNDQLESPAIQYLLGSTMSPLRTLELNTPRLRGAITYHRPPYESMIDFIFASPAMQERYVAGTYRVVLPSNTSIDSVGSDHYPVVATFRVSSHD